MLDSFFKEPLQGRLLNVFREVIMGWKHVSKIEKWLPPPPKKRVRKMDHTIS